jgi:tetratricopeptide (TPR) repeat protein
MLARATIAILLCTAAAPARAQTLQYRSRAGVEYRSQPDTGAVARAESVLAADPRNIEKIIQLGIAQSGVRQYREAIATFTRGLRIAPDNALLYRWRGHRYISVRDFDHALQDLAHGNGRDSTIYGIWYHLGVVHYLRGEFDGAVLAFAKARSMPPDDNELTGATDWLWMSLSRAGRPAEAAVLLGQVSDSLRITSAAAYRQRLRLYRGLITPEQVLTPADTADIQVATLSYGVGNWYLIRGDTVRAKEWFHRAIASGGWPGFGFNASEQELRRLR